ncbi:MAG TPA: glycosyltransferase family 4 protein [Candidatus Ruania gallistercoris]|uniref:Glycosyltransferase family 4 protein n=1 Tax=Candidatus Ruania gallistercoris TaxID=2838746 RepID=A0A9D2J4S7_9MICO|nr:glycosyltransferase family 4 protein [Candidatus Ruania gallistercoris]
MLQSESSPTRIGYVTKMYPRFSETFIVNEVLALERTGLDLEIFSLRPPSDGRFHETLSQVRAPVTYLSRHVRSQGLWERLRRAHLLFPDLATHLGDLLELEADDAVAAVELAMLARERDLTRLHAHFASVATAVARVAATIAGIEYSFTAHAKDIFHESVDPVALSRRLADAAAVVTVSDFNLDYLHRTYGPAADRVRRVYNGLDLRRFGYSAPIQRDRVVVAVGRLVEKKGFRDLIDAVAYLAAQGRPVRLDLVGAGEQDEALRDQVAALDLHQHVRLLGPLPQHRVREVVQSAGALAAPCVVGQDGNRDGLPTILLEAMALGTPCVATPVTGIPEVLQHEQTGLLVSEADPIGLAEQLDRLLDDESLQLRLAERARALIETEFDDVRTSRQLREILVGADMSVELL